MTEGQLLKVREAAAGRGLLAPWRALAARSLTPAGLMRPDLLLPLLAVQSDVSLQTVTTGDDLLLALPVERRRWPVVVQSWVSPLTPGGVPHLDCEQAPQAMSALLASLRQPLLLRGIPTDGPIIAALHSATPHIVVIEAWQRAALRIEGSFANWFETAIDRKHRKEYRRLKARLSERGELKFEHLVAGADVQPYAEALVELEASGWKGRTGTAIKMQAGLPKAFASACAGLHAAHALRFWQLTLDGRAIASLYAIIEGDCAWLGKIAYDEAFAKYSPGVLLILAATECLFAEPGLKLVDSCAIPDHPMIDHLWRDRIAIADVLVADQKMGAARFATTVAAERLRRGARAVARAGYYKLTGKRRS